jgi:hypothetical protein
MTDQNYAPLDIDKNVNYRVRPAKAIERKMLCDSFQKLDVFDNLQNYQYIGFGSYAFVDFNLFHRSLNIQKMTSIQIVETQDEREKTKLKARYRLNRPYKNIHIEFGASNDVLQQNIDWQYKSIVWLDYTSKLNNSVIVDIHELVDNLKPGSVFLVTLSLNAKISDLAELGGYFPTWLAGLNPAQKKVYENKVILCEVYKHIICSVIFNRLKSRNKEIESEHDRYCFDQLYYFSYKDGAPMMTFGGIIYTEGQINDVKCCYFDSFPFLSIQNHQALERFIASSINIPVDLRAFKTDVFMINPPIFTPLEIKLLDRKLPNSSNGQSISFLGLSQDDIDQYIKLYRHFPVYIDVEIH